MSRALRGCAMKPNRRASTMVTGTSVSTMASPTTEGPSAAARSFWTLSRKTRSLGTWANGIVGKTQSGPKRLSKVVRDRKAVRQVQGALADGVESRVRPLLAERLQQVGHAVRDLRHLLGAHPTGGHAGASQADPAGIELGRLVVGDGVAVEGDADAVGRVLHLPALEAEGTQVDQHQVVVGATGGEPKPALGQAVRHRLRVLHD